MTQNYENKILLEDFKDFEKFYQLDMITGKRSNAGKISGVKVSGYASEEIKIGFLRTRKVFIALFAYEDALILLIDGKRINLLNQGCVVRRKRIPLTWTYNFSVAQNDEVLISFWYSFITFETWPDDGDILTYVTNIVAESRQSILRSFLMWSSGCDISASKLDEEVEKMMRENKDG